MKCLYIVQIRFLAQLWITQIYGGNMSPIEVAWNDDKNVVIATCSDAFQISREITLLIDAIINLVETQTDPVDLIMDIRSASMGLDDIIMAANHARKNERSVFRHPQISRVVVISTSKLVELGAKGINSPAFGNRLIFVAASVEEGLAMLRQPQSE
jgi:hypothetical protein